MTEVRLFPLEGSVARDPGVQSWFDQPPTELRELARKWFSVMKASGPDVLELLHDGHPTVCVAGIALGYVNAFTEHINVGFYLGSTLRDPAHILEGTGRFMRHVKVRSIEGTNHDALRELIGQAYVDLKDRLAQ
jgi:hypothetical protein